MFCMPCITEFANSKRIAKPIKLVDCGMNSILFYSILFYSILFCMYLHKVCLTVKFLQHSNSVHSTCSTWDLHYYLAYCHTLRFYKLYWKKDTARRWSYHVLLGTHICRVKMTMTMMIVKKYIFVATSLSMKEPSQQSYGKKL